MKQILALLLIGFALSLQISERFKKGGSTSGSGHWRSRC